MTEFDTALPPNGQPAWQMPGRLVRFVASPQPLNVDSEVSVIADDDTGMSAEDAVNMVACREWNTDGHERQRR